MMAPLQADDAEDLREFALGKMSRVLGPERAHELLDELLAKLQIRLRTPDDLAHVAQAMAKLPGFEGAVGAMLGVAAVLRGATPDLKKTD